MVGAAPGSGAPYLLTRDEAGAYLLTDLGAAPAPALESLDTWAKRWSDPCRSQADQRDRPRPS